MRHLGGVLGDFVESWERSCWIVPRWTYERSWEGFERDFWEGFERDFGGSDEGLWEGDSRGI